MLETALVGEVEQLCLATVNQVEGWIDAQEKSLTQMASQPEVLEMLKTGPDCQSARRTVLAELQHAK